MTLLYGNQGCLRTGKWAADRRLDNKSRMMGDCHVRFCESVRVRFPRATRLARMMGMLRRAEPFEYITAGPFGYAESSVPDNDNVRRKITGAFVKTTKK